jgi:hypothetical protein
MPDYTAGEDDSWMLPSESMINVTALDVSVNTLEECAAAACGQEHRFAACQFISFDYSSNACFIRQAPSVSSR